MQRWARDSVVRHRVRKQGLGKASRNKEILVDFFQGTPAMSYVNNELGLQRPNSLPTTWDHELLSDPEYGDLTEFHCGVGTFTTVLSPLFRKVRASISVFHTSAQKGR